MLCKGWSEKLQATVDLQEQSSPELGSTGLNIPWQFDFGPFQRTDSHAGAGQARVTAHKNGAVTGLSHTGTPMSDPSDRSEGTARSIPLRPTDPYLTRCIRRAVRGRGQRIGTPLWQGNLGGSRPRDDSTPLAAGLMLGYRGRRRVPGLLSRSRFGVVLRALLTGRRGRVRLFSLPPRLGVGDGLGRFHLDAEAGGPVGVEAVV